VELAFTASKPVDMSAAKTILPALVIGWLFAAAALAADSLVDPTFNSGGVGPDYIVEQVLEAPDGKILICGLFTKYNGQNRPWIARLNADGSLDTSFNPSPNTWVRHMVVQPDGKIVIAGEFTFVENVSRNLIARLNPDGSLDRTFNPGRGLEESIAPDIYNNNATFVIWSELQPDGKILVAGNFKKYDGFPSMGLARINPDGSRDTNFNIGSGLDSWGRSTRVLPNKQILVTGWFTSYNGHSFNRLMRLNEDGTADTTLNAFFGDKTSCYSVVVQPDDKLIVCGHSINEQGLFNREIKRLNPDGSDDLRWGGKSNEKTECLLLQDDGKVILVGYFTLVNEVPRARIARLNGDGTLDDTFRADANELVWTVAPARDQRVLVCGGFTNIDGIPAGYVARLNLPERQQTPAADVTLRVELNGPKVVCSVNSEVGFNYVLQYKSDLADARWTALPAIPGTGDLLTLTEDDPDQARFYRVEVQ
jgi:uncharacterized delta-60 repeat protein